MNRDVELNTSVYHAIGCLEIGLEIWQLVQRGLAVQIVRTESGQYRAKAGDFIVVDDSLADAVKSLNTQL